MATMAAWTTAPSSAGSRARSHHPVPSVPDAGGELVSTPSQPHEFARARRRDPGAPREVARGRVGAREVARLILQDPSRHLDQRTVRGVDDPLELGDARFDLTGLGHQGLRIPCYEHVFDASDAAR
jgi:hypothetical protein